MAIVTLTTDWGLRDQHVAVVKGLLLQRISGLTLIDLSHDIQPYNIAQAAYVFGNAYRSFPEGTIHFIGVCSFTVPGIELLAIKKEGYYFIGMNDGFFSLVFDEQPTDMVSITPSGNAYAAYDIVAIVNAIIHIAEGKNIYELGNRPASYYASGGLRPVIEEDVIRGCVLYIDEFGNAITNINRELFEKQKGSRRFEINARRQQYLITELSNAYTDAERGNVLALFNTAGLLEIAINHGNASTLLGLKNNDMVRIDFL